MGKRGAPPHAINAIVALVGLLQSGLVMRVYGLGEACPGPWSALYRVRHMAIIPRPAARRQPERIVGH